MTRKDACCQKHTSLAAKGKGRLLSAKEAIALRGDVRKGVGEMNPPYALKLNVFPFSRTLRALPSGKTFSTGKGRFGRETGNEGFVCSLGRVVKYTSFLFFFGNSDNTAQSAVTSSPPVHRGRRLCGAPDSSAVCVPTSVEACPSASPDPRRR